MYYDSINGIVTIPVFDIDHIHIQRYFEWICDISHIFLDMVPRYLCGFCFGSRWTWRLLCELVPTVGDRGIRYLNMASLMQKINQRILGFPILIHSHIRCHTCHARLKIPRMDVGSVLWRCALCNQVGQPFKVDNIHISRWVWLKIGDEHENRIQKKLGIECKEEFNLNLIPTCLIFIWPSSRN
jgi:ribosomal protein L37AE/L43A